MPDLPGVPPRVAIKQKPLLCQYQTHSYTFYTWSPNDVDSTRCPPTPPPPPNIHTQTHHLHTSPRLTHIRSLQKTHVIAPFIHLTKGRVVDVDPPPHPCPPPASLCICYIFMYWCGHWIFCVFILQELMF